MFMNKKFMALWQTVKFPWFKREKPVTTPAPRPMELIEEAPKKKVRKGYGWTEEEIQQIADSIEDDQVVAPVFESEAKYGVHPGLLSDHRRKIGGHSIETAVHNSKNGIILGYSSKIKRNDGTIETIKILTAEEAEQLALEEQKLKEAAMGYPPRCPDCKALLPEGTVLGMGKPPTPPPQRPYQVDSEFSNREMDADDGPTTISNDIKFTFRDHKGNVDIRTVPLAKVVTEVVKKKRKSGPRRKK